MTNLFPFPFFQETYATSEENVIISHVSTYQRNNRFLSSLVSTPMVPSFLFGEVSISEQLDPYPVEKVTSYSKSSVYVSHTVDLKLPDESFTHEPTAELSETITPLTDESSAEAEFTDEALDPPFSSIEELAFVNEINPIVLSYPEKKKKKKKHKNKKKNMFILDDLSELNSFNKWLLGLKPNNGGHVPVILKKSKKKTKKKERATMRQGIAQSVQKSDKLISESLAIILKNQHHYEEAIVMYEQLILLIPEKSAYFAAQIEEIKKNIH